MDHPKIVPDQIIRVFKSITARELLKKKPDLKRDLWGGELDRWLLCCNCLGKNTLEYS